MEYFICLFDEEHRLSKNLLESTGAFLYFATSTK
jgi:hypothetical protein